VQREAFGCSAARLGLVKRPVFDRARCAGTVADTRALSEGRHVARTDVGHGLGVLESARASIRAQADHGAHAVAEAEAPADAVAGKVMDRGAV